MASSDLRGAFNSVSQPRFTCVKALLSYERSHDVEWQILSFSGIGQDGTAFTIVGDKVRPHADVLAAARETAQNLLNRSAPNDAVSPPPDGAPSAEPAG